MSASERSETELVFGYGSLINPHSLIERFCPELDYPLGEAAAEKWGSYSDRLSLVPARLRGYRRDYCVTSENHDSLALAVRPEDGASVNGVVVGNLTPEERRQIDETEEDFLLESVPVTAFDSYDTPAVPDVDSLPDDATVTVYCADPDNQRVFDFDTDRSRNEYYHRLIQDGIELLGEEFGDESFERVFQTDFEESTHHPTADGFETIAEEDHQ